MKLKVGSESFNVVDISEKFSRIPNDHFYLDFKVYSDKSLEEMVAIFGTVSTENPITLTDNGTVIKTYANYTQVNILSNSIDLLNNRQDVYVGIVTKEQDA